MAKYNKKYGNVNTDNRFKYAPLPLVIDGKNVWTNVPETYISNGYYPIKKNEMPVKEGFYYTSYWVIENDECVQKWEEHQEIVEELIEEITEEVVEENVEEELGA